MFNVTPTDPGDVNEEQVHQTLQKIARKIRVHDPKCNLDLKLGFQSCHKMKNWNMKKFNKQIPRINKSQQKFALNFSGCGSAQETIMKRVSLDYIKRLTNIKDYKFTFNSKVINDIELKRLGQNIGSNAKALQNAAFVFYMCPRITDSGIRDLLKYLSIHKPSLKRLELDFSRCDELTPAVLVYLAKRLKRDFIHLRELELSFLIKDVNNEVLLLLGASLGKMKSLQLLKLNIS